jgi:integrase
MVCVLTCRVVERFVEPLLHTGEHSMDKSLLGEFRLDWLLAGKAEQTANNYVSGLTLLLERFPEPSLADVKTWLASIESIVSRRKRGQAVRAVGQWAESNGYDVFPWWIRVPLAREIKRPQETATEKDYRTALQATRTLRDRALIEVLWSCGLRRSEIARLEVSDVNFSEGFLIVRTSKTGKPRIAPLSPSARHALRKYIGKRSQGSLFDMTTNAIRLCLQRLDAPSAHAWRRGWAVQALRNGVSETSVRAAAGWSSGAMVARYTRALSGELAITEFQRSWVG